ncbi:RNA-directed RNA polymerase, partial [ssRNA phage Gephyllon.1_12]
MSIRLQALYNAVHGDLIENTGKGLDFYKSCPSLCPDFTHVDAAAWSLVNSLGKKYLPRDTCEPDAAALTKFLHSNILAGDWVYKPVTSLDEVLFGTFKDVLYQFFTPRGLPLIADLDQAFLHGRCGPGSAVLASGEDFYSKMFSSRLSYATPILKEHYLRNVHRFPEWLSAESFRSAALGDPMHVNCSRLSFVPKTTAISRTICVEPSLNMFYQLGLGTVLERRLRSFFKIDLSKQPEYNRENARVGSLDGSLSTIDLESASDSISTELCRQALPKEVFDLLMVLRTPSCSLGKNVYTFNMISTMGNGFTFPLQTIIFASAVSAVYRVHGRTAKFGCGEPCGVFGDDIIVHSDMYDRIVSFLAFLGFRVNSAKSFSQGPFRESCGCDFFNGRNIRGVYAKSLDTVQDIYSLINALTWFSARTGLFLPRLVAKLKLWCDVTKTVPPSEDPSSGVQVPLHIASKRGWSRETQAYAYVCYVSCPKVVKIGDGWIAMPKGVKRRIYNPSGLMIGFLSGMALSAGLPARNGRNRWRTKRRYCSSWNRLPPDTVGNHDVDWQRWETASSVNLLG